jgi:multiple sugar transport system ATP-binding protein
MASLSVRNVSKSFSQTSILDDVSFEVSDGEFCVLLGPSGCGKTTLLRLVAGLEFASSGKIFVGDEQVDPLPPRERDIAFVFQNYALYPHMTVFDNLAFSLRLRGLSEDTIKGRVTEAARLLEIADQLTRKPQQLSGGQRQRVAVGRAIVRQPKIFLFDEPLSNLDASLRANMRIELTRLHQKLRSTIVYVTHDQTEAMSLGEKIVILNRGKIQQIGSPSAIYHQPINTFVAAFVGTPQMNLIAGQMADDGVTFRSGSLRVDLSRVFSGSSRAHAGKPITVGIRPEAFQLAEPGDAWIAGAIDLVEDLGADRFVHVQCGGLELIARANAPLPLHRGEPLHLKVEPNQVHLFEAGNRLTLHEV